MKAVLIVNYFFATHDEQFHVHGSHIENIFVTQIRALHSHYMNIYFDCSQYKMRYASCATIFQHLKVLGEDERSNCSAEKDKNISAFVPYHSCLVF